MVLHGQLCGRVGSRPVIIKASRFSPGGFFDFMIDPAELAAAIRGFPDPSDGAVAKSFELILMLLSQSPAPFSREQFTPGHVTASGLVISPDGGRILIVHHRRLDRWLLPGGHVEPSDNTVEAATAREVEEETSVPVAGGRLGGADVHGIPGKGREPYHLHHDLLFWFHASTEACGFPRSRARWNGARRRSSTVTTSRRTCAAPGSASEATFGSAGRGIPGRRSCAGMPSLLRRADRGGVRRDWNRTRGGCAAPSGRR